MSGFHAVAEDVPFDFAGAALLADEFRSAARVLDEQSAQRPGLARGAREQWRGRYAEQFDQRSGVCVADGHALARALRAGADGLDELAAAARQEQQRREAARRWEQQQNDRAWYEKLGDNIHDFFMGEDDFPPPPPPQDPPNYRSAPEIAARR
ncbi:MAG: hypothetical protein ABR592_03270 [Nitriliruptorales bacterium]